MEKLLTTEQVLLLENLTYLKNKWPLSSITEYADCSVRDLLNDIDVRKLESDDYGNYMTGDDWKNIITAINNDSTLLDMKIVTTHTDNKIDSGGGGVSVVFINETSKEAVVAFQGSASKEWKDNFIGGGTTNATDGVSTQHQENALEWYKEAYNDIGLDEYTITVTGHSKGGNKAKYIAILDDTVDRCISFDGQGFSDEFIEKYYDFIDNRQGIIENNNVDYDYVNILLNDVGNTTYYYGYDYGRGRLLEAHCPNTFFQFDSDGNAYMTVNENGQAQALEDVDQFLNSLLRSMSGEEKAKALEFIGELMEDGVFSHEKRDANYYIDFLIQSDNLETAAYIISYLIEYEQRYPEFGVSINELLDTFEMNNVSEVVKIVEIVVNSKYFDQVVAFLGEKSGEIPSWLLNMVSTIISKNTDIDLSEEELKKLLSFIGMISDNMNEITITPNNGADIKVNTISYGKSNFKFQMEYIRSYADTYKNYYKMLENIADELSQIDISCLKQKLQLNISIRNAYASTQKCKRNCNTMLNALNQIATVYEKTEKGNVELIS